MAPRHAHSALFMAVPQLGSYASSGRSWWLWASKVAEFGAFDHPGAATLPLVAALMAHLLLSLSALVFTVPACTKLPHVLDGLYRAQAFTARSAGVMP